MIEGISSDIMRKLRTNAGDKDTSNAKAVRMAGIHNTKYEIPLDHPILRDHGVFYPRALKNALRFEITLAPVSDVVVYSNAKDPPNYTLTNIHMKYSSITSDYLASKALASYMIGRGFMYENIILEKTFTVSRPNDGVINENINVSRRSMTGILCLFIDDYAPGTRDSEMFVNPDITSIRINIDGKPNCLYSNGMIPRDLWKSIIKRFGMNDSVEEADFYTDKFAL